MTNSARSELLVPRDPSRMAAEDEYIAAAIRILIAGIGETGARMVSFMRARESDQIDAQWRMIDEHTAPEIHHASLIIAVTGSDARDIELTRRYLDGAEQVRAWKILVIVAADGSVSRPSRTEWRGIAYNTAVIGPASPDGVSGKEAVCRLIRAIVLSLTRREYFKRSMGEFLDLFETGFFLYSGTGVGVGVDRVDIAVAQALAQLPDGRSAVGSATGMLVAIFVGEGGLYWSEHERATALIDKRVSTGTRIVQAVVNDEVHCRRGEVTVTVIEIQS